MAGRHPIARALTALVAVVAAALTSTPAMAAPTQWRRAACFSGAVDSIEVSYRGQAFLTIAGHLDCGTADKEARFGYARFDSASEWGQLRQADLRRYRHTSPSPFAEGRYVQDGPVDFAICVVTDYDVQIDCVQVLRTGQESAVQVQPLADKDVTYGRPVRYGDGGYRPACGGCW